MMERTGPLSRRPAITNQDSALTLYATRATGVPRKIDLDSAHDVAVHVMDRLLDA